MLSARGGHARCAAGSSFSTRAPCSGQRAAPVAVAKPVAGVRLRRAAELPVGPALATTPALLARGGGRRVLRPVQAKDSGVEEASYRTRSPEDITVAVAGVTGYIGRAVTDEIIARGYKTIALAREKSGIGGKDSKQDTVKKFPGAQVEFCEPTEASTIGNAIGNHNVDVFVCCLASRTGGKKDSWLIDYQATKNCMEQARKAGASHFVLLSAICVQKPLLEFQRAKLQVEDEIMECKDMTYSIVRPTAFFKSLAGQVESVKKGGPYVWFGDGELCACKPISESDLASFIADCILDESKVNAMLPIGGPGKAYTPKQQADLLFRLMGKDVKSFPVPVSLMDGVIGILDFFAQFFPNLEDAAEFGRIGKYYATESMLVYDPMTGTYDADATPSYGEDTLESFFRKALEEGLEGQELGDQAVFGQK